MPWNKTTPVEERKRLLGRLKEGFSSVTELARAFGVSRKTVYKWWGRYEAEGEAGLKERPRTPRFLPHQHGEDVRKLVLGLRKKHPRWGPRKLLALLKAEHPEKKLPGASTVSEWLKRAGMNRPRKRGPRCYPISATRRIVAKLPNELWCADFKGEFKTKDGKVCYPLTVTDAATRYLIACVALDRPTIEASMAVFEQLFSEFGIPEAIRTDNGVPFASGRTLGGLTKLSAGWVRYGIRIERSRPAKPCDNGRHERFHRTLKEATVLPPRQNLQRQQMAFDEFREEYNFIRPHEALGMVPPAHTYSRSSRAKPTVQPLRYPPYFEMLVVPANGLTGFMGKQYNLGPALAGEVIGLEEVGIDKWRIHFADLVLGEIDTRRRKLFPYDGKKAHPVRKRSKASWRPKAFRVAA
jgi:transposase InsO family protein